MNLYLLEDLPPLSQDTAVCLGTFDGVHLGHQVLARQTVQAARQEGTSPKHLAEGRRRPILRAA